VGLDILQPYGPSWNITGIELTLFFTKQEWIIAYKSMRTYIYSSTHASISYLIKYFGSDPLYIQNIEATETRVFFSQVPPPSMGTLILMATEIIFAFQRR
jgi:hypothetical protein